jgi:hypothetical protein
MPFTWLRKMSVWQSAVFQLPIIDRSHSFKMVGEFYIHGVKHERITIPE